MKIKTRIASSIWDKVFGLIDKRNKPPLLFDTRFGIHTFFVWEDIDVLVLDHKNYIKKISVNLRPFSFLFYNPMYNKVLELPGGFINSNKLKLGDKIELDIC